MLKSGICVPSCHIYVQITLPISKVQYICPKLRYVYPNYNINSSKSGNLFSFYILTVQNSGVADL